MLKHLKSPEPAGAQPPRQTLRALNVDLNGADDDKIRQIVGLSEESVDNPIWRAVLEPLRPRLAALRPVRALRFTRLLFMPLDDLLVPARHWRAGQAAVPRTVLQVISDVVRAELGAEMAAIEKQIAGRNTSDIEVAGNAGLLLWGRAGAILAQTPPAANWAQTGLPLTACTPLMRAIATVMRSAAAIRYLLREAEVGVLEPSEQSFADIISGLQGEPPLGCAMVFRLILGQFPHAATLLRRLADAQRIAKDKAALQAAMDCGLDGILGDLESQSDLMKSLSEGALFDVGTRMTRIAALLRDIGDDPNAARHRPRLKRIREQLDTICRARIAEAIQTGLAGPLTAASAPVDGAGQKQLEACARTLRIVETVGRKLGSPAAYDALLAEAEAIVEEVAKGGNLSPIRAIRLVEILSGPDAAERMYRKAMAK
jgi:hypothetical protein